MAIRPLKRFGQNFLKNPIIAREIVNSLQLESQDALLEIGPGQGVLSRIVFEHKFYSFIAVEIDKRLASSLESIFSEQTHCQLYVGDILEFSFKEYSILTNRRIKVLGNIPYNITSPILFKLLDNVEYVSSAILMIQKEVAERLTALPGTKEYGILSVVVSNQANISHICDVKPDHFFPKPDVESSVIRLDFSKDVNTNLREFRHIVRRCFQTRRKTLKNNLIRFINPEIVSQIKSVTLSKRPEELDLDDFRALVDEILSFKL
jgi:16S rRNA (adenine1518-N6/adenine1519-N6)-dimethyltransferase